MIPPHKIKYAGFTYVRTSMAVVLRGVPRGVDWGFYSNEEPRMHLQTLNTPVKYKIWLESGGHRVVEPAKTHKKIPKDLLARLRKELENDDVREIVERDWVNLCIDKDWITAEVSIFGKAQVTMYPSHHNRITRTINFNEIFPNLDLDEAGANWKLDSKLAALALCTNREQPLHIFLPPHIWV